MTGSPEVADGVLEAELGTQWAGLATVEGASLILASGMVRVPPECCGAGYRVGVAEEGRKCLACGACGKAVTWTSLLCPYSDPELELALEEWLQQDEGYSVLEAHLLSSLWLQALEDLRERELAAKRW